MSVNLQRAKKKGANSALWSTASCRKKTMHSLPKGSGHVIWLSAGEGGWKHFAGRWHRTLCDVTEGGFSNCAFTYFKEPNPRSTPDSWELSLRVILETQLGGFCQTSADWRATSPHEAASALASMCWARRACQVLLDHAARHLISALKRKPHFAKYK